MAARRLVGSATAMDRLDHADAEGPLDRGDQDAICADFESKHLRMNTIFGRAFGLIACVIAGIYVWFALQQQTFRFRKAGVDMSVVCSWCTVAMTVVCGLRANADDTRQYDPQRLRRQMSIRRYVFPALIFALVPTTYHLYLAVEEIYESSAYQIGKGAGFGAALTGSVQAHQVLCLWPMVFVFVTEYAVDVMQRGFCDIEDLKKYKTK